MRVLQMFIRAKCTPLPLRLMTHVSSAFLLFIIWPAFHLQFFTRAQDAKIHGLAVDLSQSLTTITA